MLSKKMRNIRYALRGIKIAWQEELSFKLQLGAMIVVLALSWLFAISPLEWIVVVFMIGFVLATEAYNTALEQLCDKLKVDPDPHIAKIKDLAAAAVLIASVTALIVGAIIFIPHLLSFT